jgi:uncharacterized protein YbcV (DUF1398 family)
MDDHQNTVARTCLDGAASNTMTFPQVVRALIEAGFESYMIDFRRAVATYYLPNGENVELPMHKVGVPVTADFDASLVQAAVREAQQQVPEYTYVSFCKKIVLAGCAAYVVSFSGRRVLYFGRTAETHVEHFPD